MGCQNFVFLSLFKMDWGKWDYFISFWAEMTCLNSSCRNIFCLLPVAELPSYSCLQGKLGVLLWLKNARILQYHHPWLKLWAISAFSSTEHNAHTMCVCAWQCCHSKLWLLLCFYLPLSHFGCVFSSPLIHSQHLSRQTHHSSSGSPLQPPIHQLALPADLQA